MATDVEDKPQTTGSNDEPLTRSELEGLSRSELLRASPRMFESDLLDKASRATRRCRRFVRPGDPRRCWFSGSSTASAGTRSG